MIASLCRSPRPVFLLALLCLALSWISPSPVLAQPPVCTTTQLTDSLGMQSYLGLTIDDQAARVAFSSSGDFTGQNADGSFEAFALSLPGGAPVQITDEIFGTSRDTLLAAAGDVLFFGSSSDLTGGNPDGNLEVVAFDFAGAAFTQLTNTVGIHSLSSLVRDAGGDRLAFVGMFDPLGTNPDGNQEVFRLETATQVLSQVTMTSGLGVNAFPSLSGNGNLLALASTFDLAGMNADGSSEIFVVDLSAASVTQVTDSAGESFAPAISTAGDFLLFVSEANLDGSNPEGNSELFLADLGGSTITALTNAPAGMVLVPHLAADGSRASFASNADYTGQNADGSFEVFLLELATMTLTQITDDTVGTVFSAIDGDGSSVVFASNADLTGDNPDGNQEVFLYDCPQPGGEIEEIPVLGGLGLVVLALSLVGGAMTLLGVRRRLKS